MRDCSRPSIGPDLGCLEPLVPRHGPGILAWGGGKRGTKLAGNESRRLPQRVFSGCRQLGSDGAQRRGRLRRRRRPGLGAPRRASSGRLGGAQQCGPARLSGFSRGDPPRRLGCRWRALRVDRRRWRRIVTSGARPWAWPGPRSDRPRNRRADDRQARRRGHRAAAALQAGDRPHTFTPEEAGGTPPRARPRARRRRPGSDPPARRSRRTGRTDGRWASPRTGNGLSRRNG